jgi:hypothetical protein
MPVFEPQNSGTVSCLTLRFVYELNQRQFKTWWINVQADLKNTDSCQDSNCLFSIINLSAVPNYCEIFYIVVPRLKYHNFLFLGGPLPTRQHTLSLPKLLD